MRNIIIYGAGQRAELALNRMRRQYPDAKIVFCDSDINKIGNYVHDIPILSRDEAKTLLNISGGVYISSDKYHKEIQDDLILSGFCSEKQIINRLQKYLSCEFLETNLFVNSFSLDFCCLEGELKPQLLSGPKLKSNIKETIDLFIQMRDDVIKKLQNSENNPCVGCKNLKLKYWNNEHLIKRLVFSQWYWCQCNCIYCDTKKYLNADKDLYKLADKIDMKTIIDCLENKNLLDLNQPIAIASGEITTSSYCEKLFDTFKNYSVYILTNGVIYDANVAKLISRKGSALNISLDAGTKETYHTVKGLNAYDKVTNNIRHYKNIGGNIELKYILLPENINRKDLDGFINFVKEIKPNTVQISRNLNVPISNIKYDEIEAARYLYNHLKEQNIFIIVQSYFGDENMKKIIGEDSK